MAGRGEPWPLRVVRRAWLPFAIVAVVVTMTVGPGAALFASGPRRAPAEPCALVPADLLARLVPTARIEERDVRNDGRSTTFAVCAFRSAPGGTSTARLWLRVERHGDRGGQDPAQHAQDDFARRKRVDLGGSVPVRDLRGLGDSAYLAVGETAAAGGTAAVGRMRYATVRVLRGEAAVAVRYEAAPSAPELAAGAAVAVARAVLREVP